VPATLVHRIHIRFADALEGLRIGTCAREEHVGQSVPRLNGLTPTVIADAKLGTVRPAELILFLDIVAYEGAKLPSVVARDFGDVVLPTPEVHVVAVTDDGPNGSEVAVVVQATPHDGNALGGLTGGRPDSRHSRVKLRAQRRIGAARRNDDGVVRI